MSLYGGDMAEDVEIRKLLIQFCRKVSKKKSEALSDHGVTNILCWSIVSNQNEKKLSHGAPARTLGGGSGVSMGSSLDKRQTTFWTKHSRGLGIISLDIQEAGHQIFHFNRSLSLDHIRSSIILSRYPPSYRSIVLANHLLATYLSQIFPTPTCKRHINVRTSTHNGF